MLNYKLCAIASALVFTAVVPSTFASAPQTKIKTYPNRGCLRVVGEYEKNCKVQAIVKGEGPVAWTALAYKQDESGGCEDGNIKVRPDGRVMIRQIQRAEVEFHDPATKIRMGSGRGAPTLWELCVPSGKGAGRGK